MLTKNFEEAAEFVKRGGVAAFPTETVYGLAARLSEPEAIKKLFEAKTRPADNPLIAHIGSIEQLGLVADPINANAQKLIDAFFPGPLTLVLKKLPGVPEIATAGLNTIGVRMPENELAQKFILACGGPVVAPSANLSGRPSPTTWQAVLEDMDGRIECILLGEATRIGLESTVVDCTEDVPVLLRKGAISLEQLRTTVPETRASGSDTTLEVRSPGLRHRHYSPRAQVVLVFPDVRIPNDTTAAFIGLDRPATEPALVRVAGSVDEYAREVFEFFRECDRAGVETIYCQAVGEEGIGAALMDRLRRAAGD